MSIYGYRIRLYIYSIYPRLTVPVSSVSARIRSDAPSYLQVTIPDYDTYNYAISLRSAGNMHVYYKIMGTGVWNEILWTDIENIYTYVGATSKSIVLSGHRTFTLGGVPTTRYIRDYSYVGTTNKTIIRCGIDQDYFTIGDRIVAGSDADIIAESYTYTINRNQATLEITGT